MSTPPRLVPVSFIIQCQRITGMDWKKILANLWNRKKTAKKAHAGRGPETI
jgi:hypothetical protein